MFVLDASVALSWVFPDEQNENAGALFQRLVQETALVPPIWPMETGSGLFNAIRRGRITADRAWELVERLLSLPVELDRADRNNALKGPMRTAMRHQVSIYDAAYLELAERRQLPLATLDRRLREACSELNIPVLPAHV